MATIGLIVFGAILGAILGAGAMFAYILGLSRNPKLWW